MIFDFSQKGTVPRAAETERRRAGCGELHNRSDVRVTGGERLGIVASAGSPENSRRWSEPREQEPPASEREEMEVVVMEKCQNEVNLLVVSVLLVIGIL